METFKTFQKTLRRLGEEKFLSRHPHPFLISPLTLIQSQKKEKASGQIQRGFATTITGRDLIEKELETAWAEPGWVIPLAKKRGAPGEFPLEVTLGKSKNMDIIIPLPSLSNHHGTFLVEENNRVLYRDNDSDRGSFLNGKALNSQEETPIQKGDTLGFGKFLTFEVYGPQDLFGLLSELEG